VEPALSLSKGLQKRFPFFALILQQLILGRLNSLPFCKNLNAFALSIQDKNLIFDN
jgi:hypothetical protein